MTLYSIFERQAPAPAVPAAVPDRFSWFAALLPPVFALAHGLWLELVAYVVALAGIALVATLAGAAAAFWLYVLLALLVGFEAASLRGRALRRKGYAYRTELVATAADLAEVEWLKLRSSAA